MWREKEKRGDGRSTNRHHFARIDGTPIYTEPYLWVLWNNGSCSSLTVEWLCFRLLVVVVTCWWVLIIYRAWIKPGKKPNIANRTLYNKSFDKPLFNSTATGGTKTATNTSNQSQNSITMYARKQFDWPPTIIDQTHNPSKYGPLQQLIDPFVCRYAVSIK